MDKPYGLIKSDKTKVMSRPSIFNSDSDSNNESEKPTGITALKKKERIAQEKVLAEDPTIYQYDELYDDMESKRKESKLARKDLDRKPKYINKLLETAERRKRENERRIERQVQKERELEGDMYKDKEAFVTSAYRKKLEEFKELEEKERREDYLEAIGDVKKQQDLSGFYRHLYAQQVNYEDNVDTPNLPSTSDKTQLDDNKIQRIPPKTKLNHSDNPDNDSNDGKTIERSPIKDETKQNTIKKRKYRKREDSKSEEDDLKTEKPKLEHLPSNIDADSDFSIDSDSDSSDSERETKKNRQEETDDKTNEPKTDVTENEVKTKEDNDNTNETKDEKEEEIKVEIPKRPKIDIWKKRTVGPVFDEALKRYYERKAARLQPVS